MDVWNTAPFVGKFLKGLRVRCIYIAPSKDDIILNRKGKVLDAEDPDWETLKDSYVFQIKEVKWPEDIPTKNLGSVWGELSINEIYDQCMSTIAVYVLLCSC